MQIHYGFSKGLFFSCFVLALLAGRAGAYNYTVTVLPSLGGTASEAYGINDLNQVVGWSTRPGDDWCYPCLWTSSTTVVDLGYVVGKGFAYDINNAGQVVGQANNHAFFYENGNVTDLGTLGGARSEAYGINNSGQVVGMAEDKDGYARAFLWDKTNGMRDLGSCYANGINNSGQIVGELWDTVNYCAGLWPNGDQTHTSITPGEAYDINDSGQVILRDAFNQGFVWQDGQFTALGVLDGYEFCFPQSISNSGYVIGYCDGFRTGSVPFVWTQEEGMVDLNTLMPDRPFDIGAVRDTNNYGHIICTKSMGDPEALLLVHAPEPATFVLLATGILPLLRRRK
jgi:probable HAF family extracellular repeat protein